MIFDYMDFWLNNHKYENIFIRRKIDIESTIYEGQFFMKNNPIRFSIKEEYKLDKKFERNLNRRLKNYYKELEKETEELIRFSVKKGPF